MAAPHLSSISAAAESRNPPHEKVARPPLATGSALSMNPQTSSPLHAYPEPVPAPGDASMPSGPAYFQRQRSQPQSLSQEDQNLANSLSHNVNGQITSLEPQIANGQAQSFGLEGQNGLPQTPHQPLARASMVGQHSGADPNHDLSYGEGTDRRKRSKVSRACDECRRKKVRCDSTTTDGNVIETCSNCRRLKLTCQFERAPMKRGPSKGYIKELAERVQQVESQMGIPAACRPSVDAGSPSSPYADQPYSPTEPLSSSRKRTFSQFDGRNPFAQYAHASQDRTTSQSGYSFNQGPQNCRGSIALAPDQQLTDISPTTRGSTHLATPFWAEDTEVEHPRTKKPHEGEAPVGDAWKADSLFGAYIELLHNDISVLPKSFETVQHHVVKCSRKLASAFTYTLAVACGSKPPDEDCVLDAEFEEYVWASARSPPPDRDTSENIVWLWVYAFMLIDADADVCRLRGMEKKLSKLTILKVARELGRYLLMAVQQEDIKEADDCLDSNHCIVRRTCSCIDILAQLHTIGSGTEDMTSLIDSPLDVLPTECRTLLSEETAFLADLSSILSLLTCHMSASAFSRADSIAAVKTRRLIESFVDILASTFAPTSASSSLIQEAQLFISLLLARHTFVDDPSEILDLALKLVDFLQTEPVNPRDHKLPIARPLDVHLYTLTGLTLLELVDSEDADLVKPSQDALAKLRHALEQTSERAHARWPNGSDDGQLNRTPPFHWADALLRVVDAKDSKDRRQTFSEPAPQAAESTATCQNEQQDGAVNGGPDTEGQIQLISAHQQYLISRLSNVAAIQKTARASGLKTLVVDFSLLTRRGYLNVLADLNGC